MNRPINKISVAITFTMFAACSGQVEFVHSGNPILVGGDARFELRVDNVNPHDVVISSEEQDVEIETIAICDCAPSLYKITSRVPGDVTVNATLPNGATESHTFSFIEPEFVLAIEGNPSMPIGASLVDTASIELFPFLDGELLAGLEGVSSLRFSGSWNVATTRNCDSVTTNFRNVGLPDELVRSNGVVSGTIGFTHQQNMALQDITIYDSSTLSLESIEVIKDSASGALSLAGIDTSGNRVTGLRGDWESENLRINDEGTLRASGSETTITVRYQGLETSVQAGSQLTRISRNCPQSLFGACGLELFCTR